MQLAAPNFQPSGAPKGAREMHAAPRTGTHGTVEHPRAWGGVLDLPHGLLWSARVWGGRFAVRVCVTLFLSRPSMNDWPARLVDVLGRARLLSHIFFMFFAFRGVVFITVLYSVICTCAIALSFCFALLWAVNP